VTTTWKHRKKAAERQKILTISLAVLTFLFGTLAGHWWSYKQSKVNQLAYELERTKFDLEKAKFDLEKAKFDLEKIPKIIDIRNNIEATFVKIIGLYKKHDEVVSTLAKYPSQGDKNKIKGETEMLWKHEFPPLRDDLAQLESMLSQLENRGPREFNLPALAPVILSITRTNR